MEEMYFVNKPKNCSDCTFCDTYRRGICYCSLLGEDLGYFDREKECPIKSVDELDGYKLKIELAGADEKISLLEEQLKSKDEKNLVLYSLLFQVLEKQGIENVSSEIDQMTGEFLNKQAEWFKSNRNYDELKQQLTDSEKRASENYQEGYELYLKLKQFYSRLGVEAYPDNEIQDAAIKELNKLLKE